ncbi:hypothetical protein DES53_10412 [Roseimicrobium gellanilyticum]|uniref:Uncharacterized protein n=2 Tax=Roseimicrobium gellanilyticum TaxID=748857 RepID=A0A366HM79_9BACT|nr:hypothetical protein DES53_10412 [Roseimicrobium gellanilyticum]
MSPQTPEEIKQLVESGLEVATWIPLREVLEPYLTEPYVRSLRWPYSKPVIEVTCWIVADLSHHQEGLTLAYSKYGHGSHAPWGIVLASDTHIGRDDSWFAYLEDAYINCGAWKGSLPEEYEIR